MGMTVRERDLLHLELMVAMMSVRRQDTGDYLSPVLQVLLAFDGKIAYHDRDSHPFRLAKSIWGKRYRHIPGCVAECWTVLGLL